MAKEYSRTQRVAEQIQRDLAQLIQFQIRDPRLGMVTVSHVRISKDLSYAEVFVTVLPLNGADETEATQLAVKILNDASGYLRTELAKGIKLRIMPQLRFTFDDSVDRGRRLHTLISDAVRKDAPKDEE
ncbi:MAG: 30S ribosome-binding factor RbfA [Pontibacterium sp.]